MSIESKADLKGMTAIGRIVGETLKVLVGAAGPGMTTAELDRLCERELAGRGARPTPRHAYGFPGAVCISINDEVVHAIPGPRVIGPGDVVKIDLTADKDGYVADASRTVVMPFARAEASRLAACARSAFDAAMAEARAGRRARDVGRAVEREVRRHGFAVVRQLYGHGVGRAIHEPPSIPNFDDPGCPDRLTDGLVITVEPIVAARSGRAVTTSDGWTVRTLDGSLSAHHEETILITRGEPVVLTAA